MLWALWLIWLVRAHSPPTQTLAFAHDKSVLNISETGLDRLPEELSGLRKLKALVAMGNPWAKLDSSVLEQWDQLNSISQFAVRIFQTLFRFADQTICSCLAFAQAQKLADSFDQTTPSRQNILLALSLHPGRRSS